MTQTEDFQLNSIKSQQKETLLFLAITFVLLLFRILVLAFNKFDIQSIQVSRSFIGNGFLSKPLFSELFISILIILLLFGKEQIKKPLLADLNIGLVNALWFLSFPVITGLCLFTFKSEYYFKLQFNEMLLLRWLYFILTFVAVNKIFEINPFHKFLRGFLIILILLLTSILQDFTSNSNSLSIIYATLSGVGLTQAFSIIAFRNTFKNSFWAGLFSAMFTSSIVCFFIFGAVSGSYFTFLLPFIALLLAAVSMHGKSLRPRIICLLAVSLFSILLSLVLPSLFPQESRNLLRENQKVETKYHDRVYNIQINYNDTTVRKALIQVAKVLNAANQVSQENFGFSPDIKWITIYGIQQGGFNAVYPQGMEGNFISQEYIKDILDSKFLNNPDLSCQFPDPINSILHEYSHLYGIFPYQNWIRTESEGWATYSATRLSKLIYQKYGSYLWQPAYNYAKFADSINVSLLSEHPLIWSHPEEVGPFKMWNSYELKVGLQNVYKSRRQYTTWDKSSIYIQKNIPSVINDFINTKIGKESFNRVSIIPSKKFEELYKPDEWKILGQLINKSDDEMNKYFGQMKMKEININVPGPRNNSSSIENILIISLLLLFILGKLILKNMSVGNE
jgi:hypothetical protein